jgi:hypothetical protein
MSAETSDFCSMRFFCISLVAQALCSYHQRRGTRTDQSPPRCPICAEDYRQSLHDESEHLLDCTQRQMLIILVTLDIEIRWVAAESFDISRKKILHLPGARNLMC